MNVLWQEQSAMQMPEDLLRIGCFYRIMLEKIFFEDPQLEKEEQDIVLLTEDGIPGPYPVAAWEDSPVSWPLFIFIFQAPAATIVIVIIISSSSSSSHYNHHHHHLIVIIFIIVIIIISV
ncbi:Receptor-Type Tyrosine-Protein Phosphatase Kappa [Manis pentadactyla]|nr:Receptor-Type Tyrosine-Protein Phosphatase Kappa [Manis pentadactyla]